MRLLTTLAYGSIPFDDEHTVRVDPGEVCAGRSHDRVEPALGPLGDRAGARFCAGAKRRIRLHDDDLPARELERRGVNPGEAELEHASGAVAQQLEDQWRRGGGESRRQPRHGQTLTFAHRGASTRLRSHPSNLIRVMPAKGVRWFHAASRLRAPIPAEGPGSRPT